MGSCVAAAKPRTSLRTTFFAHVRIMSCCCASCRRQKFTNYVRYDTWDAHTSVVLLPGNYRNFDERCETKMFPAAIKKKYVYVFSTHTDGHVSMLNIA